MPWKKGSKDVPKSLRGLTQKELDIWQQVYDEQTKEEKKSKETQQKIQWGQVKKYRKEHEQVTESTIENDELSREDIELLSDLMDM